MADTSLTPTQAANIDADPVGDLVLVIGSGDDQKSIRASSKVLSLASPVLAAMFSPGRFSEGAALSSSSPPEICLPEDDPEAVIMFCLLVHFREYHGNKPVPSYIQLKNIALFCDKYDAGLAVNHWSEIWLQDQLRSETYREYDNLLALAYAFNNQESFWISSRWIMLYQEAVRSDATREDEILDLLPEGLYGSIDEDRKSGLLDLSSMIEHIMAGDFQKCFWAATTSDTHLIRAGYLFQQLYLLQIWSISTRVQTINLDYIQKRIDDFNEREDTFFKEKVMEKIANAVDAQKGLCLACVRKGKVSSHQGNCHARRRYLCTG